MVLPQEPLAPSAPARLSLATGWARFRCTTDPDTPDEQILLDIPTWNFDWQTSYQLAEPLRVTKGQVIRMECSWDRSIDPNRTPKYIVFAEGTEDEMCFGTYALVPDDPS